MIPFKLDEGCVYTDTDFIFITTNLTSEYLGKDIGLFKDVLQ